MKKLVESELPPELQGRPADSGGKEIPSRTAGMPSRRPPGGMVCAWTKQEGPCSDGLTEPSQSLSKNTWKPCHLGSGSHLWHTDNFFLNIFLLTYAIQTRGTHSQCLLPGIHVPSGSGDFAAADSGGRHGFTDKWAVKSEKVMTS